jgi:Tol biopolymer transport system component
MPVWQPNSAWVVFNIETGRMISEDVLGSLSVYKLYRINVDSQAVQPITFNAIGQAYSPIWDNSGEHLLFSLHATGDHKDGIYISAADGTNPQLLIAGKCFAPIALSPDGAYLAYGRCSITDFQWVPNPNINELLIYDFRTKESINLRKTRIIGWQTVQE